MLTVTPATAAKHVLAPDWAASMISCLRDSLELSEEVARTTQIYPSNPRHCVVIHNIPLRDAQQDPEGTSWWKQNLRSISDVLLV